MTKWLREREIRIDRELLGYNTFRALLIRSTSTRLVQDRLSFLLHASFKRLIPGLSSPGAICTTTTTLWQALKTAWRLVSPQLNARDRKLPRLYIFRALTHSSCSMHVAFSLSSVYRKTQIHILFWNPQTYTASQRSICNNKYRFDSTRKLYQIMRLHFWRFGECGECFHWYYSQVHSDPESWYLLESNLWVKFICLKIICIIRVEYLLQHNVNYLH